MYTTQKMTFSIKDFFSKYDQIRSFLRIWSYLLKNSLVKNLIFCVVVIRHNQKNLQLLKSIYVTFFNQKELDFGFILDFLGKKLPHTLCKDWNLDLITTRLDSNTEIYIFLKKLNFKTLDG